LARPKAGRTDSAAAFYVIDRREAEAAPCDTAGTTAGMDLRWRADSRRLRSRRKETLPCDPVVEKRKEGSCVLEAVWGGIRSHFAEMNGMRICVDLWMFGVTRGGSGFAAPGERIAEGTEVFEIRVSVGLGSFRLDVAGGASLTGGAIGVFKRLQGFFFFPCRKEKILGRKRIAFAASKRMGEA